MRILTLFLAISVFASPVFADRFTNTSPGYIHTCDSATKAAIGLTSTADGGSSHSKLTLGPFSYTGSIGARLQLNYPQQNSNGIAAFFENYLHGGYIPVLRILKGTNFYSNAEISSWNLTNGDFYTTGKITTHSGFWVNSTQLNVPDYVFDPDYDLRSLEETERFVQEHRHLPGVPSAREIKKEGLNMTEMNPYSAAKDRRIDIACDRAGKTDQGSGESFGRERALSSYSC